MEQSPLHKSLKSGIPGTTWVDAREGDEVQDDIKTNKELIKVDPYACAIRG